MTRSVSLDVPPGRVVPAGDDLRGSFRHHLSKFT
jgi:hypothetical protein